MQSKCPRNELHIFSISKAWNELHKQWKKRKTSPKPLDLMDGRGNQRSSQMWWRNEQEHPSPEPRTARTSELNGSGGGRWKRIRGQGVLSRLETPTGTKGGVFYPGWWLQPGQKAPVPPLAQLAVGPGTKAAYCPGPKGCRDKWPGIKACSVVVHDTRLQPKGSNINISFCYLSVCLRCMHLSWENVMLRVWVL